MNQSALRLFVRSILAEAKDKKAKKEEPKKAAKKDTKKAEPKKEESSKPKSSGKLVDLKKEIAYLRQMSEQLQEMGLNESEEITEVGFSNLQKFVNELTKVKQSSADLKKKLDEEIATTEAKIQDEKNKIKEMMGLIPETSKDDVEEARFKKGTDIGKPGKGFEKIAKSAAKKYGSEEAGKKVAGAVLKKVVKK